MAELIDSSVFIEMERRRLTLGALEGITADPDVALASITASELLVGVHRADTPQRRAQRESFIQSILHLVPVLAFDLEVASRHAEVWAHLQAAGQPIGEHDLIIASTALVHGYAVLTQNLRHFGRVPGLVVRQPGW